jgi:addiction module RelE/StbE family toxin
MRIRWTTPAARDLTSICNYIEEQDGPAPARRVALAIYERVDQLREFPLRGRPGRVASTRELVIPGLPYLVIYRVSGDTIQVNRILHGAQKWP